MIAAVVGLAITSAVLIAVPGPSVMYLVGQALARGRWHALKGVLGNSLGTLAIGLVVAFGLAALLLRFALLSDVLRGVGALVLVIIGAIYLRQARDGAPLASSGSGEESDEGEGSGEDPRKTRIDNPFVLGFVVGVTNPKAIVIFATVVPAFLPRGAGASALLLLTLVPVVVGLIFDPLWVELAHRARGWLARSPRSIRIINAIGGALMILIGIALAVEIFIDA